MENITLPLVYEASTEIAKIYGDKITLKDLETTWSSVTSTPFPTPAPVVTSLAPTIVATSSSAPIIVPTSSAITFTPAVTSGVSPKVTCPFLITRGDRKGLPCGKTATKGSTHCSSHKDKAGPALTVVASGGAGAGSASVVVSASPSVASASPKLTCPFVITRGDRKGLPCGKTATKGSTHCSSHKDKAGPATVAPVGSSSTSVASASPKLMCTYTITRGDRKGQPCGKSCTKGSSLFCSSHKASSGPTPTPTTFIPHTTIPLPIHTTPTSSVFTMPTSLPPMFPSALPDESSNDTTTESIDDSVFDE